MLKWLEVLFISVCAILAPIQSMLLTVLILIVVDLVTGVMVAHKRSEPITSAGFRRSLSKLFVYELALILGFITQKYLLSDAISVTKMVSGMIGMIELKSVYENLNGLSGQDLLQSILAKLNSSNLPKGK